MNKKNNDYKTFMNIEAGEEIQVDTDSFGNIFSAEAGCILNRRGKTSGEELLQEDEQENKH